MQAPIKILVLQGHSPIHSQAVESLRHVAEVVETPGIEQAVSLLRTDQFAAIFSDAGDFLPLERALVSQQATLILNTIGEGVCIVDGQGHVSWMNKRLQGWPARCTMRSAATAWKRSTSSRRHARQDSGETPLAWARNRRTPEPR